MDWSKGYNARYYATIVDRKTMKDVNTDNTSKSKIGLIDGTIQRSYEGLRESADLTCENYSIEKETYIRVWLDTYQNGGFSHTPLFTGIASSPGRNINGNVERTSMQCYSMLKLADDILLPRGWYAPYDASVEDLLRFLLAPVGTEIEIKAETPKLKYSIISEAGETRLTMADKIISSIEWKMRLDGLGNIIIEPADAKSLNVEKVVFGSSENDIIEPTLSIEYDWFNSPNIVRVIVDNQYAVARDDDPESPLSTVSRGREVWLEDTSMEINANESISKYAIRKLKEYQAASVSISYDRRYMPDIYPYDTVRLNYPAQNIFGLFIIKSQTITLGFNAKTSEEVVQI